MQQKPIHKNKIPPEYLQYFDKVEVTDYPTRPAIVADIFCGSGTSGVVARRLGRHFVGLDLSLDYLRDQARKRLALDTLDAMATGAGIEGGADDLEALPLFGKPVESAGE